MRVRARSGTLAGGKSDHPKMPSKGVPKGLVLIDEVLVALIPEVEWHCCVAVLILTPCLCVGLDKLGCNALGKLLGAFGAILICPGAVLKWSWGNLGWS